MKKVIILDCGPSLEDVYLEFGQSPEWIMESLKDAGCCFIWVKSYDGQAIESNEGDAWIITGSPRSVYEEENWMLGLEENIRDAAACKKPVLGICFGHQLIAKSFGGRVEVNPYGWELGSYPISLTAHGKKSSLFNNMADEVIVYESHQDSVTVMPNGAVELAYNQKCIQAFQLKDVLYSVQFHPEFSWDVMKKYVPDYIINAEKQGFSSPDASWFKGESIDFVKRRLFNGSPRIYDIMDRSMVESFVQQHLSGKQNRRLLIWSLLNVEEYLNNTFN